MLALVLLLQAAASPPIDLTALPGAPGRCEHTAADGEIIVCGSRDQPYRLKPLAPAGPRDLPPMTVALPGGGTANLHGEQVGTIDGKTAPAAMVTVRVPF